MTPKEAQAILLDAVDNLGERVALLHEALEAGDFVSASCTLENCYEKVMEANRNLLSAMIINGDIR